MTCRRVLTSVLIASCCLAPNLVRAQGPGSYQMSSPYGGYSQSAPPGGPPPQYQSPYGNALYANPGGGTAAQNATYGPPLPYGILGQKLLGPDGERFNDHISATDPSSQYPPANPYTAVPGVGYAGQDGIVTRKIPQEDSWDEDGPLERIISTAFQNSYVRLEYLNWSITAPTGVRLGAPVAGDPNNIAILDGNLQTIGLGRIPTTDRLGLRDNNGVKLTWGLPTIMGGNIEFSGFLLAQGSDQDNANDLPADPTALLPRYVVTSTLTNGAPAGNLLLYDRSYSLSYKSDVWGTDVKYLFPSKTPEFGPQLQPLLGARFLSINEFMSQRGVFDNLGTVTPLTSLIESSSYNNMFGAMVGARLEFTHPWFTIGVEPKAGLGLNSYQASVETTHLRSLADGAVKTTERNTIFSPVFEGNTYGRFRVTDWFNFSIGYNWMYMTNVVRAHNIIYYNDNGPAAPPGLIVKPKTDSMLIKGLMVGGELRF